MAAFLDLPREVRDIIYEYCLVVKGEIVPYPACYEFPRLGQCQPLNQRDYMRRRPDVALLQVNQQFNEETSPILYGRNLWRLSKPISADHHVWWKRDVSDEEVSMSIKHVIICLDWRDMEHEPPKRNFVVYKPDNPSNPLRKTLESRTERGNWIHDAKALWLQEYWEQKLQALEFMSLKTLTIEITHCWCGSFGCCRPFIGLPIGYFFSCQKLTIKGVLDDKEAQLIKDTLLCLKKEPDVTLLKAIWCWEPGPL